MAIWSRPSVKCKTFRASRGGETFHHRVVAQPTISGDFFLIEWYRMGTFSRDMNGYFMGCSTFSGMQVMGLSKKLMAYLNWWQFSWGISGWFWWILMDEFPIYGGHPRPRKAHGISTFLTISSFCCLSHDIYIIYIYIYIYTVYCICIYIHTYIMHSYASLFPHLLVISRHIRLIWNTAFTRMNSVELVLTWFQEIAWICTITPQ